MRAGDVLESPLDSCMLPITKEKDLNQRDQEMNSLNARESEKVEKENQLGRFYHIKDKLGGSGR